MVLASSIIALDSRDDGKRLPFLIGGYAASEVTVIPEPLIRVMTLSLPPGPPDLGHRHIHGMGVVRRRT